jgi:hypothetical protein
MVCEWKTFRTNHIIKTIKGKKERIALAATEKANVWTSVRVRYLSVGNPRWRIMRFHGVNTHFRAYSAVRPEDT